MRYSKNCTAGRSYRKGNLNSKEAGRLTRLYGKRRQPTRPFLSPAVLQRPHNLFPYLVVSVIGVVLSGPIFGVVDFVGLPGCVPGPVIPPGPPLRLGGGM